MTIEGCSNERSKRKPTVLHMRLQGRRSRIVQIGKEAIAAAGNLAQTHMLPPKRVVTRTVGARLLRLLSWLLLPRRANPKAKAKASPTRENLRIEARTDPNRKVQNSPKLVLGIKWVSATIGIAFGNTLR